MKLYYSPLACSLATRIACYEAGAEISYVEVDPKTKRTEDGADFRAIHPLGLVPALEVDGGQIITENAAILQLVADRFPEAELAPRDPLGRARLQQWLCFIGTELHKALYIPLLDRAAPAEAKAYALAKAGSRLGWVAERLREREFLLDRFSVADAYLFTVLNWSTVTPIDLKSWPAIAAYQSRLHQRPSVARAFAEERERYFLELKRHGDAPPAPGAHGPRPAPMTTAAVIDRFNDAFQRHDPSALADIIANDCVLENSQPAPDGSRHVGRDACLEVWQGIAGNRAARFDLEAVTVLGDRAIIQWRYRWGDDERDSVRGVNLMRVRDGLIVEGLGYVKGS